MLFGQIEQLLQSAYRCVGRYPFGSLLKSTLSLVAFASMIVAVSLGSGARVTALVFALANILGTLVLCVMVRRDIPWVRYGWTHASFGEIRKLARPAIAFMGFPLYRRHQPQLHSLPLPCAYLSSMLHHPQSLRPEVLLARVMGRSKPNLEC